VNVITEIAPDTCRDCKGSGRNGTLGGYPLTCRLCDGFGSVALTYGHWQEAGHDGQDGHD
jgi:hypothetical protein